MDTQQPIRAALSVTITRADGTVEDLGVVSFKSRNPIEEATYLVRKALGLRVDEADVLACPPAGTES